LLRGGYIGPADGQGAAAARRSISVAGATKQALWKHGSPYAPTCASAALDVMCGCPFASVISGS